MNERDTVGAPRGAMLGGAAPLCVRRLEVAPDLVDVVEHAWFIAWDLTEPHRQLVLPRPAVNLTVEPDTDAITGVRTRAERVLLRGRSQVWGLLFRPAGFAAFAGPRMHELRDRELPIGEVLAPVAPLRAALLATERPEAQLAHIEDWLRPQRRPHDEVSRRRAEAIVETIRTDPSITTVAALEARTGCPARGLQRLLRAWVGLSPKALVRRFRLHEAAHALTAHPRTDLGGLARTLGYADQAHFCRDFRQAIGQSPARYARDCAEGRAGG